MIEAALILPASGVILTITPMTTKTTLIKLVMNPNVHLSVLVELFHECNLSFCFFIVYSVSAHERIAVKLLIAIW